MKTLSSLDIEIEGISTEYCNDFECSSSPSVEQSLKRLAQDIQKCRWSKQLLANKIMYKDQFRSFTGRDKFARHTFFKDYVDKLKTKCLSVKFEQLDTAVVRWRLEGRLSIFPLTILGSSTLKINLISGQVLEQTDAWDFSECPPPSVALFYVQRSIWSFQQQLIDLQEDSNKQQDDQQSDGGSAMNAFQYFMGLEEEQRNNDIILFTGIILIAWLSVKFYTDLFVG